MIALVLVVELSTPITSGETGMKYLLVRVGWQPNRPTAA